MTEDAKMKHKTTEKKAKRAWLAEQINAAKKSYDKWPNWMKKAARFEGSDCERLNNNGHTAMLEWAKTWPRHCKTCGGWGVTVYTERHGFTHGPGVQMIDPCDDCVMNGICARCGRHGLGEDGEGPCKHCGWDYDDGVTE